LDTGTDCLEWRIVELAVAALEPLHVEAIQGLLQCSRTERIAALKQLSSFFVVDANRKLHVHHKSFSDWLTDSQREDADFYVDLHEVNEVFANRCLEILKRDCIAINPDLAGTQASTTKQECHSE
jgi:hypothetical protein